MKNLKESKSEIILMLSLIILTVVIGIVPQKKANIVVYFLGIITLLSSCIILFNYVIKIIQYKKDKEQINKLRIKCIDKIIEIEGIFALNGYSIRKSENYMIGYMYDTFESIESIRDYKKFLNELTLRVDYVNEFVIKENKRNTYNRYKESFKQNTNTIIKYLRVLQLPDDTTNFELVKKAYRKLIKDYHPDKFALCSEEEKNKATELSVKINNAYKELERVLKVS